MSALKNEDLHGFTQESEIAGIHEATGRKRNISLISVVTHSTNDASTVHYKITSKNELVLMVNSLEIAIEEYNHAVES